jgi:hypothetical protein
MRTECGQASVEWVGTLLLVALALAGLAALAGRVDDTSVATAALRTTTCAAAGGCAPGAKRVRRPALPREAVTVPPLLPVVPVESERRSPRARGRVPSARLRRGAGALWRRAWLVCFGYERARHGVLHPESRPRQTVPLSDALQMVNDCVSPVDFARDWELLTGR